MKVICSLFYVVLKRLVINLFTFFVTNCDSYATFAALAISKCGIGRAPMTNERDHTAEAYFAVVGLLESAIISPVRRHELEKLREKLEKEMAAELDKSGDIAAD
jgi:hypothetical protein